MTAGTKVTLPDGTVVKAKELSGSSNILFIRNSVTGAVEARDREGTGITLNAALHDQRLTPTHTDPHRPTPAPTPVQTRAGPPEDQTPCRPNDRARPSPTPGHDLQRNVDAAGSRRCSCWPSSSRPAGSVPGTCSRASSSPKCTITAAGSTETFDPEQTGNAALIAALSVKRGMPPRAATIAITTAFQESKIRNLRYGDRDSLGLFQQRPSQGWGTAEQILDPVHATNAFYDALVKYQGYETADITKIAQRVQKSGYPEAYRDHEGQGRVLASNLTGHSPAGLTCRLDAVTTSVTPQRVASDLAEQMGVTSVRPGERLPHRDRP